MAKKSTVAKAHKLEKLWQDARKSNTLMKMSTRRFHICPLCGRTRGYIRYFDMCRICVRESAIKGELNGFFKSSK